MTRRSVGIIGAGASGIGVARQLKQAGIDFEIVEATSKMGGNWQPTGPSSKMYESAHLISSKKNTQFTDHPMPQDYPAYPRHSLFYRYLNEIAETNGLQEATRFDSKVTEMKPAGDGWRLAFEDGGSAEYEMVILCNGLLGKPVLPAIADDATCESFHAVEYKSPSTFTGKRVLIVGGGNSGCDIAVDATKTAERVFHSTRRGYHYMPKFIDGRPTQEWLMDESAKFKDAASYWEHVERTFKLAGFKGEDFGLPAPDHPIEACHPIMNSQILFHIGHGDIDAKPDLESIEGDTAVFSDGTREQVDVIVWATGYRVDIPFLDPAIFDWRDKLSSTFLRMVPAEFDNLLFVGYLNSPSGIGNLVNTMARFVVSYVQGRQQDAEAFRIVRHIAQAHERLDLGQGRFMQTDRHRHEVDLWKFLRSVNFVTAKLVSEQPMAEPARLRA